MQVKVSVAQTLTQLIAEGSELEGDDDGKYTFHSRAAF